jgi:hypothetical protein
VRVAAGGLRAPFRRAAARAPCFLVLGDGGGGWRAGLPAARPGGELAQEQRDQDLAKRVSYLIHLGALGKAAGALFNKGLSGVPLGGPFRGCLGFATKGTPPAFRSQGRRFWRARSRRRGLEASS